MEGDWVSAQEVVLLTKGLSSLTVFVPHTGQTRVLYQIPSRPREDEDQRVVRVVEEELKDGAKLKCALDAAMQVPHSRTF